MEGINLVEIWNHMGPAQVGVVVTLFIMGIASTVVGIERVLVLMRARAASAEFAAKARKLLSEGNFEAVRTLAAKYPNAPLAQLMGFGLRSFAENQDGVLGPVEMASRELSRKLEDLAAQSRRGVPILATTGSTAPFVGLFGTVIGIITVFGQMAKDGGGGFATVSGGIAEALIVTGLGLVIAIAAVWIFNYLNGMFEKMDMQMQHASSELVDFLENKGGAPRT